MTQEITTAAKNQMVVVPEKRANVPMQNGRLMPDSIEGIVRLAKYASAGRMLPKGIDTEAQAIILLISGFELGLSLGQTLKGLMIVNNRPSVWGDVALGLARMSPKCKSIKEWSEGSGDAMTAHCQCVRDGEPEPIHRSFSVAQAKKAGKWGAAGPWTNYPDRMLQMRARAFAIRDAFPEALGGLSVAEEQQDAAGDYSASPDDAGGSYTVTLEAPAGPERVALPEVPEEATAPLAGENEAQRAKDADGASFLESLKEPPVGTVGHKK